MPGPKDAYSTQAAAQKLPKDIARDSEVRVPGLRPRRPLRSGARNNGVRHREGEWKEKKTNSA